MEAAGVPARLHDLGPEAVRAAREHQATLTPPWQLQQLREALTTAGVPRFADTTRSQS
jgi:hypothetical protein